ncbi:hypothetical protein MAPG_10762 [Magnaporthiopsis poae ATCC 64411]|uniref:Uncharacterized protein n=1 Tax=Magnaporthiopsis poae (strain ATCC 64411 / 73-15) TaxID=644358 RepID=A0A0C4EDG3_MAGP6|nr:hypothetical protein MAPG_10762 [Magnaporthiopsis poae ATCC 64411]
MVLASFVLGRPRFLANCHLASFILLLPSGHDAAVGQFHFPALVTTSRRSGRYFNPLSAFSFILQTITTSRGQVVPNSIPFLPSAPASPSPSSKPPQPAVVKSVPNSIPLLPPPDMTQTRVGGQLNPPGLPRPLTITTSPSSILALLILQIITTSRVGLPAPSSTSYSGHHARRRSRSSSPSPSQATTPSRWSAHLLALLALLFLQTITSILLAQLSVSPSFSPSRPANHQAILSQVNIPILSLSSGRDASRVAHLASSSCKPSRPAAYFGIPTLSSPPTPDDQPLPILALLILQAISPSSSASNSSLFTSLLQAEASRRSRQYSYLSFALLPVVIHTRQPILSQAIPSYSPFWSFKPSRRPRSL